ncbi:MAG: APC family permease [Anaerovoracaceae bacterium]|jgi:putrescine importer
MSETKLNQNLNEEQTKLKRTMTLPLVIMFGLAYLAPTVVFNYYGLFETSTKGMYALALIITTIVMVFTALSYTRMVKAYPVAGSAYTYVAKSVQPHVGFLAGWLMLLDYILLPMICYLLLGVYVNTYFPAVPVWLVVVILAVLGAVINILGIKIAGTIDTVITGAAIVFTVLFILVVIHHVVGGGGTGTLADGTAFFNHNGAGPKAVLAASAILCASFLGFDAVTTLAEETKNPDKVMGKAIMGVVVGAGIVFVIVAYFAHIAWPDAYLHIKNPNSGIFELFPQLNGWIGDIFFVVDNCGSFVCAMTGISAVSRILYGMGRDNILPKKAFGHLSKKFQTPSFNIILTSVVAMTAIFYADNVMGAASLVAFGACCGFFLVNLSVIFHYWIKKRERGAIGFFRNLLFPIIGMGTLIVVFIYMEKSAKILGLIWLGVGIIYLAIKTKGFKELPPEMSMDE